MLDIDLRQAVLEDLDLLVDLYMDAYQDHPEYGERNAGRARRYLKWLFRHATLFRLAEVHGEPAGFVVVDAQWEDADGQRVGEIHELAVRKTFWGRGVGKRLLEEALHHLREAGLSMAALWVGEHNVRAQAFYERAGFRVASQWGPWVRMVKRL